jgi:putative redox protein
MARPPVSATLEWTGDLCFEAVSGRSRITVDSDGVAGPSPVQTLAISLAGCMAVDVVDIVRKGRHEVRACQATLTADRAEDPPRRLTRVHLAFTLQGSVPGHAVERAIALSRDKYCSVWHSMRHDIDFTTSYEVHPWAS